VTRRRRLQLSPNLDRYGHDGFFDMACCHSTRSIYLCYDDVDNIFGYSDFYGARVIIRLDADDGRELASWQIHGLSTCMTVTGSGHVIVADEFGIREYGQCMVWFILFCESQKNIVFEK
jgi:hypothetical protein